MVGGRGGYPGSGVMRGDVQSPSVDWQHQCFSKRVSESPGFSHGVPGAQAY